MAVPAVSIHTFAVPYHAAQFCRGHGILDDAHKGVPQLVQTDRRVNAVAALVKLPVVIEAVLILQQEDWIISPKRPLLFKGPLLQLSVEFRSRQRMQDHRADSIFVLAVCFLIKGIDSPANVNPVSVQIAYAQPQQLPGAQAGQDRKAVCMDIGILFNLATDDACIYRKQNPQRVRLKDLSALWTCSPGYREPLVLWPQGGVFVLPCPISQS